MKRILAAVVAAMMLLCAMPVGVGARANAPTPVARVMLRFDDGKGTYGCATIILDEEGNAVDGGYVCQACDTQEPYCESGFARFRELPDEYIPDGLALKADDMVLIIHGAYAGVYCPMEGDAAIVFDGVDAKDLVVMPYGFNAAAAADTQEDEPVLPTVTIGVNGSNSLEMVMSYIADLTFVGDDEKSDKLTVANKTTSLLEMLDRHPKSEFIAPIVFDEGNLGVRLESIGAVTLLGSYLTIDGMTMEVIGSGNLVPQPKVLLRAVQPQEEPPVVAYGISCFASKIAVKGTLNAKSAEAQFRSVAIMTPSVDTVNGGNELPFMLTVDGGTVNAVTVKSGAVLTAIGGETDNRMDGDYEYCSAGIDLYDSKLTIEDGADVLAKGYDMAIIGWDSELDAAKVSGEMSEDYSHKDTNTVEPLAEKLATCFVAQSEDDSPELFGQITKYKYVHIYTPEEDDDPAGFNLFLLMLMMAQIDTEITGEGTVTHDGNTRMAYFNKPRTFTITPAEGWKIESVLYKGESLGAVETVEIIPTARKSRLEVIFTEIPADGLE